MKKNAEKLKAATVETAKESERRYSLIWKHSWQRMKALWSTIDEVMHIQQEGRQKRREAESKLMQLEDELKNKMLNPRG
ncbi:MAG: toxic anion resistance protein [Anaerobutyricum sp.]